MSCDARRDRPPDPSENIGRHPSGTRIRKDLLTIASYVSGDVQSASLEYDIHALSPCQSFRRFRLSGRRRSRRGRAPERGSADANWAGGRVARRAGERIGRWRVQPPGLAGLFFPCAQCAVHPHTGHRSRPASRPAGRCRAGQDTGPRARPACTAGSAASQFSSDDSCGSSRGAGASETGHRAFRRHARRSRCAAPAHRRSGTKAAPERTALVLSFRSRLLRIRHALPRRAPGADAPE